MSQCRTITKGSSVVCSTKFFRISPLVFQGLIEFDDNDSQLSANKTLYFLFHHYIYI